MSPSLLPDTGTVQLPVTTPLPSTSATTDVPVRATATVADRPLFLGENPESQDPVEGDNIDNENIYGYGEDEEPLDPTLGY